MKDGSEKPAAQRGLDDYKESVTYDANGNIQIYFRNGTSNQSLDMDELTYHYVDPQNHNRLNYVEDPMADGNYDVDIDNQDDGNYGYDNIGNLIKDEKEGIARVEWTVYGKIRQIWKEDGTEIRYNYDAAGNRISKTVVDNNGERHTFYFRDAMGTVLAVYEMEGGNDWEWKEQHLYGSSRLGMWNAGITMDGTIPESYDATDVGSRIYELANHLGNVLAVITDNKGFNGNNWETDILNESYYYPGGMQMPGRTYSAGDDYRYGFNTQEKDNEIAGEGNHYTALYWEMDPRIGRRWNLDPKPVPWESGYAVNRNNPIWVSDPNGDFGDTDKDKKRHERAQKKFDKKVTAPLRKLESSLKKSGVNDAVVRKTVQAEADRLADKYQNKSWLHWAIGKPDKDNTASSGYTNESTGWHFTHRISIRAYKSEVYDVPTIEGDRPADGSMVTTGTVGTVLPGSTVSVQFNPLAQPNSLLVTTDNGSGGLSTIATTGGMIRDEENRKGVYMFKTKTAITKVNAGQLQYEVRNSNVDVDKDTWQLKISITSPPVLNPVPLIYSGRPF